jgi:hypothetical protein
METAMLVLAAAVVVELWVLFLATLEQALAAGLAFLVKVLMVPEE